MHRIKERKSEIQQERKKYIQKESDVSGFYGFFFSSKETICIIRFLKETSELRTVKPYDRLN